MSRSKAAIRGKRFRQKMDAAGYTLISLWGMKRLLEVADHRGKVLNLGRHAIMRAAIEAGMNVLTTSFILNVERRYREVVGFPAAPHWPGSPFRPDFQEHIKSLLPVARAARKEKIRLRKERAATRHAKAS